MIDNSTQKSVTSNNIKADFILSRASGEICKKFCKLHRLVVEFQSNKENENHKKIRT
ncbi:hypothetical protein X781_15410 [Mannheimia sp. USDA-ARS-USMARC-1261]|nr:hypothetical protein X781_15410 [Mannheimia sp. USDA-ARS-USMARC-1261]